MGTLRPEGEARNIILRLIAQGAIEIVKELAADPDAVAAVQTLLGIAANREPTPDGTRLLTKEELAKKIGKSKSTIDRLDREGAPHVFVGDTKRYDLEKYRSWLVARGKRPTTARAPVTATVDVSDVIEGAGLVRQ